jgi:hypothetical protein
MSSLHNLALIIGAATGFACVATLNETLRGLEAHRSAKRRPRQSVQISDQQRVRARDRGTLLVAAGGLVFASGMLGIAWLGFGGGIVRGAGSCLVCMTGSVLVTRGRQMRALVAQRGLTSDERSPIVYLRPFDLDHQGRAAVARSVYFERSYEQRLIRALRDVGPVVALGDPSERLPSLGSVRKYSDEAHWQQDLAELTTTAGTIILHIGDSPGLAWEVGHVVELDQPERVILVVRNDGVSGKGIAGKIAANGPSFNRFRYGKFRDRFNDVFPRGLPADIGSSAFLYFEANWIPRAYDREASRRLAPTVGSPGDQRALALRRLAGMSGSL